MLLLLNKQGIKAMSLLIWIISTLSKLKILFKAYEYNNYHCVQMYVYRKKRFKIY